MDGKCLFIPQQKHNNNNITTTTRISPFCKLIDKKTAVHLYHTRKNRQTDTNTLEQQFP